MAGDLVVTDGIERAIDALDTVTWYLQCGIGTTDPVAGNTGLENITGCPAAVLAADTQPVATTLRHIATIAFTSTLSITEAGLFDGSTGSGTDVMFQRHTFTAIPMTNGESIEFTMDTEGSAVV